MCLHNKKKPPNKPQSIRTPNADVGLKTAREPATVVKKQPEGESVSANAPTDPATKGSKEEKTQENTKTKTLKSKSEKEKKNKSLQLDATVSEYCGHTQDVSQRKRREAPPVHVTAVEKTHESKRNKKSLTNEKSSRHDKTAEPIPSPPPPPAPPPPPPSPQFKPATVSPGGKYKGYKKDNKAKRPVVPPKEAEADTPGLSVMFHDPAYAKADDFLDMGIDSKGNFKIPSVRQKYAKDGDDPEDTLYALPSIRRDQSQYKVKDVPSLSPVPPPPKDNSRVDVVMPAESQESATSIDAALALIPPATTPQIDNASKD